MTTNFNGSLQRLRDQHGTKLVRFGAVSALNVILGQLVLYGAQVAWGISPVAANVLSVSIGAIPAYLLSRYWVWERRGKNHLMREVIPFWSLAVLGFVASTGSVWWVDSRFAPSPWMVNLTNLAAFGVIWVAKFVILDRVLFKPEEAPAV